ncbi:MAG: GtrA family protein [Chloroflexi bacterium]|nr:GtrA family protein [Chloroflexota bacterium]
MIESITNIYQSRPKEFNRFAKFAIVGTLGAIIDFGLLNLMRGVFGWDLIWANTLSVSVAILSNFIWNRYWTFPESRTRKKRIQLPQFALVNFIGLLINNLIVVGIDAVLIAHVGEPWSYNIAKAVAIGVVLFWNFGINRLWTYRGL